MTRAEIQAALERGESGPELDHAIEDLFKVMSLERANWDSSQGRPPAPPPYTTSIDAAIALLEDVLPGAGWVLSTTIDVASVIAPNGDRWRISFGESTNPASAFCLAILEATGD